MRKLGTVCGVPNETIELDRYKALEYAKETAISKIIQDILDTGEVLKKAQWLIATDRSQETLDRSNAVYLKCYVDDNILLALANDNMQTPEGIREILETEWNKERLMWLFRTTGKPNFGLGLKPDSKQIGTT